MIYKSVTIKSLMGIKEVATDFTNDRILTLVGLNVSGKATILEGIHLFYRLVKGEKLKSSDYNEFRPKGISFSDSIQISTELEFEDNNYKKIRSYAKKEGYTIKLKFPGKFIKNILHI